MASTTQLAALEAFLPAHPTIKYLPPSSPEYSAARRVWNRARRDQPLAIVQPQAPSDVSALVRFAKSSSLPFTIRAGGHNLEGRSIVDGALLIDLRALKSVTVAPDRTSATVQGGILQGELGTALWAEGLGTPTGTIPSVGYVGWAVYGGYGAFSSHWGLGTDQILGATIVNPDGDIVTADDAILQGIRGAGGLFGVVVDLTIKVYPLTSVSTKHSSGLPTRSPLTDHQSSSSFWLVPSFTTPRTLPGHSSTSTLLIASFLLPRIFPHSLPSSKLFSMLHRAGSLVPSLSGVVPTWMKASVGARKSQVLRR